MSTSAQNFVPYSDISYKIDFARDRVQCFDKHCPQYKRPHVWGRRGKFVRHIRSTQLHGGKQPSSVPYALRADWTLLDSKRAGQNTSSGQSLPLSSQNAASTVQPSQNVAPFQPTVSRGFATQQSGYYSGSGSEHASAYMTGTVGQPAMYWSTTQSAVTGGETWTGADFSSASGEYAAKYSSDATANQTLMPYPSSHPAQPATPSPQKGTQCLIGSGSASVFIGMTNTGPYQALTAETNYNQLLACPVQTWDFWCHARTHPELKGPEKYPCPYSGCNDVFDEPRYARAHAKRKHGTRSNEVVLDTTYL